MRILILANNDVGLYKFRKEVMEALVIDNEVFACLPNGDLIPQIEELGVKFIQDEFDRHGTNPISEIKHYLHYKKVIKQCRDSERKLFLEKYNVEDIELNECFNMEVK